MGAFFPVCTAILTYVFFIWIFVTADFTLPHIHHSSL
jgi:hypothetical protein